MTANQPKTTQTVRNQIECVTRKFNTKRYRGNACTCARAAANYIEHGLQRFDGNMDYFRLH
jgi:hypothetical protein